MDRQMNMLSGGNSAFLAAIRNVHEIAANRIFNPLLRPDWLFRCSGMHGRQQRSLRLVHNVVEEIIERKSGELEAERRPATWANKEEEVERPIFIDQALRSRIVGDAIWQDGRRRRGQLSAAEVRDETNTILVAGYETTSIEMSFLLLMLAMHPQCQDRVLEECRSVYIPVDSNNNRKGVAGGEADALRPADLELLTYLDMCISETMRLFPAGPLMTRKTTGDVVIGDYSVPAGVELMISHLGVNRSAKHWRHPERFYPEHFLPDAVRQRHNFAYLPFSAGARTCLGQRYAKNVMRTAAVHIVRQFRLTTSLRMRDLRTRWNVSLGLINGHLIRLERR